MEVIIEVEVEFIVCGKEEKCGAVEERWQGRQRKREEDAVIWTMTSSCRLMLLRITNEWPRCKRRCYEGAAQGRGVSV